MTNTRNAKNALFHNPWVCTKIIVPSRKKKKEEISECYKHLNSLILPSPEVPLSPEEIKSRFFVVVQEQYVKVQKKR